MTDTRRFTAKTDRDIKDIPELQSQMNERASEIVTIINNKGGEEKVIKRA